MANKSGIHIKKSHKGLLHKNLGITADKPIPASKLRVKSTDSSAVKKRKIFAQNAKKWKHQDGGVLTGAYDEIIRDANTQKLKDQLPTLSGPIRPENVDATLNLPNGEHPLNSTHKNSNPFPWENVQKGAVSTLAAIDYLLPPDKLRLPVVRPSLSYNQYPQGTGSQAIAQSGTTLKSYNPNLAKSDVGFQEWYNANTVEGKNKIPFSNNLDYDYYSYFRNGDYKTYKGGHFPDTYKKPNHPTFSDESIYSTPENPGGHWQENKFIPHAEAGITMSTTGYKYSSPDKGKKKLRIPSNKITMKGVPHPVVGVDNTGHQQLMMPGGEYQFPGNYVDETPVRAQMGATFQSQQELDAANQFAKQFALRKGLAIGESAYVARNIGDAKPMLTVPSNNPTNAAKRKYSVPDYVQRSDLKTDNGTAYYIDPQTGDLVDNVDISVLNQPRFKQMEYGGEMKSGGWISKAVNPSHKGYCTPMTKSTCTPRRKALARRFKSGDLHKGEEGMMITLASGDTLSSDKAKEMLRDGTAHGKKLTDKQKRYFGWVAGGKKDDGGSIDLSVPITYGPVDAKNVRSPQYEAGGPISLAEYLENNPGNSKNMKPSYSIFKGKYGNVNIGKAKNGLTILDDDTVEFQGPSHADGGIPLAYGGKTAEVEGDETGYISPVDNSLTIMGNMKSPLTGRKFKSDSKILSEKERKMDSLEQEGLELIDKNNPRDKWGFLKFNAGDVMAKGAHAKKQELQNSKEHLKAIQEAMLSFSDENGVDAQSFSEGKIKAKKGLKMDANYQAGGTWDYRGTNTKGLDDKIAGFVELLKKKGISGYSGPESGVSQRNTKSGRASRHMSGEALDAFLSQPDAYNTVLNDADLSKYLIDNGLTAINEYDPNVAKQTGATVGHLHIGYDKGTPIADKFRQDAMAKYQQSNPSWGWGTSRNPRGKSIKGAPSGDQQYFPYNVPGVSFEDMGVDVTPPSTQKVPATTNSGGFNFVPPSLRDIPSNAQPLEFQQIIPELVEAAQAHPSSVFQQQYVPELFQPYNVSFQDRLNANQATFSAASKLAPNNPTALSSLAANKYSADSQTLADEFRTNQGIYADVTNKNIGLLNDAQGKNLQLADAQYVRQETAKSNARAVNHSVLNSISSKLLQNEANNRRLQVLENLYDYRFNPKNNYQAEYKGAPGGEYINYEGDNSSTNSSSQSRVDQFTPTGKLKGYSVTTPSATKNELEQFHLREEQMKYISPYSSLNRSRKGNKYSFQDWLAEHQ